MNTRPLWIVVGCLLVMLVIYLSLAPKLPHSGIDHGDKIGHFAAYASMMFWWYRIDHNAYRLALVFILMGLTLEILQSFSGYRQGDIFDMAANSVGVGIGWLAALATRRVLPSWPSQKAKTAFVSSTS
jgi:VanZ family protein